MLARMGLSKRLNLIVVSINLVMLALVATLASVSSDAALRSQAVNRLSAKHNDVITRLDVILQATFDTVLGLSEEVNTVESLAEGAALRSMILGFLEEEDLQGLPIRISMVLPDERVGVLSLDAPGDLNSYQWRIYQLSRDLPNSSFIRRAHDERIPVWFHQGAAYFDPLERSVASIAVPYEHPDGSMVLWVDIPLSTLRNAVTDVLHDKGLLSDTIDGYALLIDSNEFPITHHDVPEEVDLGRRTHAILQAANRTSAGAGGLYTLNDPINDNRPSLFGIGTLEVNGWGFISALPEDEIPVLPSNVFLPIALVAISGVLLLFIAVNRFIANAIVRPLVDLGRSASEIGDGNLSFLVFHRDKKDEVGRLANALDAMRERLQESYDDLQRWSQTLEERVEQRTKELRSTQRQAEENAQQLQAVYDESLSVVHETQLAPVLDLFIERILTLLGSTYCAIWLLTSDGEFLQLVATNDERRKAGVGIIAEPRNQGIVGQAIQLQKTVQVDDYRVYEHRFTSTFDRGEIPFVRGICTPLMFAGHAIGAVVIGRSESGESFTSNDHRYLTLFANLVSPSVRNAQLLVQLQEAVDEAKSANEVKTRFLASVTHELRTPLNLVINNMDFMRIGAFGDVTDEQVSTLNQTVRSAEHLLYLINDLLDVSKIDAGEMQLFIQPQEVYTMLEDAVDNAEVLLETYEKPHIALRVEIEENLPDIPMDARRIRQVLNNLLSNGIKFTEEGSVTLKVFKVPDGVHFSVHDTGMGIPQEEMDILFAAFERTSAAKEHGIEGTGLGLPISRYMVQQHNSDLTVLSEVGSGTTFAFTLPLKRPEPTIEESHPDGRNIRTLLSSKSE